MSAHDLRDVGADGRTPDGKLTVVQAAKRMGVNPMFLRMGLRAGRFPFGTAIQMPGGRWSYYINARRFEVYMAGEDMAGTAYDMCRRGYIPYFKVRGFIRIPKDEFIEWFEGQIRGGG